MLLKLYGGGRSRWVRPLWMLRELAVPFEVVTVDRGAGELDGPEFRTLNPMGKIPVLLDDGRPICESGAILVYLGDRYSQGRLLPRAGTYERGIHDQWMFTTATELEQPLWLLHKQVNKGIGGASVVARARSDLAVAAAPFEARLSTHDYLAGEGFTACDIMFAHLLCWEVAQELVRDHPGLGRYRSRVVSRPAFPRELYEGVAWL